MAARRVIPTTVTPENWERLKILFDEAVALPPARRADFVQNVCVADEESGRALKELLSSAEKSGSLDRPLVDFHRSLKLSAFAATAGSGERTTAARFSPPEQVLAERYRLIRHVGKGGMGDVYEAEDTRLRQRVALKTIRTEIADDPVALGRFKSEIVMARLVTHPNVCRIHGLEVHKGADGKEMLFLTMEFLEGETLASRLKRGRMEMSEALPLIAGMAEGLSAAHKAGVIHRDFKSANVMLVTGEGGTRAVIADFGLARPSSASAERTALTRTGGVAGTPLYMAPEQINGQTLTPAADIYALGVVVYEMVTGRPPFTGESEWAIILQHLNDAPPSPRTFAPNLDERWETAILRCLRKAPEERFQSAEEVESALASGTKGVLVEVQAPRRGRVLTLATAVLCLVLLAGAVWMYRERIFVRTPSQQRVAVLKFENLGGDPANAAFCDGLMDALASKLAELEPFQGSLSVVPVADVRAGKVKTAYQAHQEFGVNLAITGSVLRSPEGVRLTVNLVDALDARHAKILRSHEMFIPTSDTVTMQQGVVTQVTDLMNIQLRPESQQRIAQGSTPVPGAYDFYLQGTGYFLAGRTGVDQAITEFQHALDLDPNYALAHAGLGESYLGKYLLTGEEQWIEQARRECNRALELGRNLAPVHVALAMLSSRTGDSKEAVAEAQRAVDLDPENDRAYSELARALTGTGKGDPKVEATALEMWNKAIKLRPGYWNNYERLAIFLESRGRYQEAVPLLRQVTELVPDNPSGYTDLGTVYHLLGRETEAERVLKKSIEVKPTDLAYSNLATVYFFEGRYTEATHLYERLTASGTPNFAIWGNLGDAYRWSPGKEQKAAAAYSRAVELARQALKVNPNNALALICLALYQAKTGQVAEAAQDMDKALRTAPDDQTILFNAAIVSELTGSRARALSYLGRAVSGGYSLNEITEEPELAKLRQDPQYRSIVLLNHGK